MTTWTTISNAAVAVGGIPSSTTVTALRDNPVAIAEASSGSPIVAHGWHPVDKLTVGDGKQGLIYDAAVNGVVSSVVTPDFQDGYQYRVIGAGLSHNSVTNQSLLIDFYKETSATYVNARTVGNDPSSIRFDFDFELLTPRVSTRWHGARYFLGSDGGQDTADSIGAYNSLTQKLLRVRIRFSAGSIDSGQVWILRRRDFVSAS